MPFGWVHAPTRGPAHVPVPNWTPCGTSSAAVGGLRGFLGEAHVPTPDTQRWSIDTSSARWRSESPPIVLLGEIRQCVRILLTLTRPYFGTARSMSKTFAVSRYSRRVEQQLLDREAAGLQIALELRPLRADLVRSRERIHALVEGPLRRRGSLVERRLTRRHGRRVYRLGGALQGLAAQFI